MMNACLDRRLPALLVCAAALFASAAPAQAAALKCGQTVRTSVVLYERSNARSDLIDSVRITANELTGAHFSKANSFGLRRSQIDLQANNGLRLSNRSRNGLVSDSVVAGNGTEARQHGGRQTGRRARRPVVQLEPA